MKTKLFSSFILISLLAFTACERGEGEGGTSTIKGTIMIYEYNKDFSILRAQYPGAREDVYIIYGDDNVYGDKFEASYDGSYEFKYLREGTYKVFAYFKDSTLNYDITSEEIPVIKEIEITGKNQVVEVPEIRIIK